MREHDRKRHQLRRIAAGIAEHHALISRARQLELVVAARAADFERLVDPHRDIGRLLVDRYRHAAGRRIEADERVIVADVRDRLADEARNVDVRRGRDLAPDVDLARDDERLAGHAAQRIVLENRVEHGIRNLVGDLIGMPLGDGFGGKEPAIRHLRPLRPRCHIFHLLGGRRVDRDVHRSELELRDHLVDLVGY